MNAPRSADMSSTHFCLISHVVLYNALRSSGMPATPWTDPLSAMIWFLISGVHNPRAMRSLSKYLLTTANSPARTRLVNMFDVNGSKDSLFPKIWAVEAVGIGARSNEFLHPCSARSLRNLAQSHLEEGVTFQRSGWSNPWDVGEPS